MVDPCFTGTLEGSSSWVVWVIYPVGESLQYVLREIVLAWVLTWFLAVLLCSMLCDHCVLSLWWTYLLQG